SNSWEKELEYLNANSGSGTVKNDDIDTRLDELSLSDSRDCLFFKQQDLKLTDGFVFWDNLNDYRCESTGQNNNMTLLYATVSHVLQEARESTSLSNSLKPALEQQVLLSPENFFRFNDTAIQAAILRAAYPCELDYSNLENSSDDIAYLIERSICDNDDAIAYEFLIAIATARIKLHEGVRRQLATKLNQWSDHNQLCKWFSASSFFGDTTTSNTAF
ncbi:MAG: hypothetical protein CUN55_17005, partial [Phototrophicales bacterium]